jgi:hypothetical protein
VALLGDAPSMYFFKQLKAKHALEIITVLQNSEQQFVTADADLISTVEGTSKEVFTVNQTVHDNHEGRKRVKLIIK